jgi:hypothetical protein
LVDIRHEHILIVQLNSSMWPGLLDKPAFQE